MEQAKNELQLVSNMIMCGDHPSITKTELNVKDPRDPKDTKHKDEEKDKNKDKDKEKEKDVHKFISYARISPTSSHTRTHTHTQLRAASEQALRALDARRRVRSLDLAELVERADADAQGNRLLVQAAMGSFRWPPYLVCVWVLVLVLTHALHCLVAVLERALPALRKACQYSRAWTEARWRAAEGGRAGALALAAGAGALYALLAALSALHAAATWAVQPLACDPDTPTAIDYDEIPSKVNLNAKQ